MLVTKFNLWRSTASKSEITMIRLFLLLILVTSTFVAQAQTTEQEEDRKALNERLDSLYIDLVEEKKRTH